VLNAVFLPFESTIQATAGQTSSCADMHRRNAHGLGKQLASTTSNGLTQPFTVNLRTQEVQLIPWEPVGGRFVFRVSDVAQTSHTQAIHVTPVEQLFSLTHGNRMLPKWTRRAVGTLPSISQGSIAESGTKTATHAGPLFSGFSLPGFLSHAAKEPDCCLSEEARLGLWIS